jgi:hypothetical protein
MSGTSGRELTTRTGELAELKVLRSVENRVLWLATSIVHHANRRQPTVDNSDLLSRWAGKVCGRRGGLQTNADRGCEPW